jgi:hypothetical protein
LNRNILLHIDDCLSPWNLPKKLPSSLPPRFSGSDDGLPLADDELEISTKVGRAGGALMADGMMVEGSDFDGGLSIKEPKSEIVRGDTLKKAGALKAQ